MFTLTTATGAIQLIDKSKVMCMKAGFKLHTFSSSSDEVLASISPNDMESYIKTLNLNKDSLPIERTLGKEWCTDSDNFKLRINLSSKPVARRGILSIVSSSYDPIGLVSPFIRKGKRILQDLCTDGVDYQKVKR